jgi:hypothetical protein
MIPLWQAWAINTSYFTYRTVAIITPASAALMHFTPVDSSYILAEGDITESTPAEFERLTTSPGTAIFFDSPGGSLRAALILGRMIRRARLNTYVAPKGGQWLLLGLRLRLRWRSCTHL